MSDTAKSIFDSNELKIKTSNEKYCSIHVGKDGIIKKINQNKWNHKITSRQV